MGKVEPYVERVEVSGMRRTVCARRKTYGKHLMAAYGYKEDNGRRRFDSLGQPKRSNANANKVNSLYIFPLKESQNDPAG